MASSDSDSDEFASANEDEDVGSEVPVESPPSTNQPVNSASSDTTRSSQADTTTVDQPIQEQNQMPDASHGKAEGVIDKLKEEHRAEPQQEPDTSKTLPSQGSSDDVGNDREDNSNQEKRTEERKEGMKPEQPKQEEVTTGGGWGWSSWGSSSGGSSWWSAAASTVSTVASSTSVLSQGLSTAISNVEETLGIPSAAELAQADVTSRKEQTEAAKGPPEGKADEQEGESKASNEEKKPPETSAQSATGGFLSMWNMAGLSTALQEKGSGLVAGSLDALETLGKKTVAVLTEDDPGFRQKRERLVKRNQPVLSEVLREAQAQREASIAKADVDSSSGTQQLHFTGLFDDYQGLIHLEALELLSRQCTAKVELMRSDVDSCKAAPVDQIAARFAEEREKAEQEEEEEGVDEELDKQLTTLEETVNRLRLHVSADKLTKVVRDSEDRLRSCSASDSSSDSFTAEHVYGEGLRSLAQAAAAGMDFFHKAAELILLPTESDNHPSQVEQSELFLSLTNQLCKHVSACASAFAGCLNSLDSSEEATTLSTSLFLEAANSCSYLQDACQLLLPPLQQSYLSHITSQEQ